MKISEHADRSERLVGIRGEDIHRWIDDLFDAEGFDELLRSGRSPDYDPYDHRKYRHCQEAIADACDEFEGKYTAEEVRAVFECHVRDDYDGYLPTREDFANGTFEEKYHESEKQEKGERILNPAELSEYFKGKAYSRRQEHFRRGLTGFRLKIVLPTVIAIVLFVTSVFVFVVPFFRDSMLERKKETIRELTAAAISVIDSYVKQEQAGKLSKAAAQKLAASKIELMRYGAKGKDYFWITDMHPRMIMHPYRPELVGKDLRGYTDTGEESGRRVFVEFVRIVRAEGAGYSEYLWQWMDDRTRTAPKLSYVKRIPAWGWVVGTGIYIDDVQAEIDLLTRSLVLIFVLFGLLLAAILAVVVWQSRRIEDDRLHAEAGLHEAKERYRALVEASKEGYVLHIDGECVYSNRTLQRMLGYDADELAKRGVLQLLMPDAAVNESARESLSRVLAGDARAGSFDAQLMTSGGDAVDVIVNISKIFFSQKNGHVLSFRPIKRTRVRTLLESFVDSSLEHEDRSGVIKELEESRSVGRVVRTINRLALLVREMADQGVRPGLLRHTIGEAYDASVTSLIKMALREFGEPPVPFAFLSLGSNARHEMTMFSDQDNALVFADVSADEKESVTRYFLKLANSVCSDLNEAGYSYCPGGIMAVNPQWCLPVTSWKERFADWVQNCSPESLLEFNAFFDIHCVYGKQQLVEELENHIHQLTDENHTFFMQFARNCLLHKVPAELVASKRASKAGGAKQFNIKECLKPLEIFVKIHALKHKIGDTGTIARLRKLEELSALPQAVIDETVYIFDYLWRMRFYNQLFSHADLKQVNDTLDLASLTEVERQNLGAVLARLTALQQKLCGEFLGMPLHMV